MQTKTHQGFTIVELVVVIVLLGILAAVALPRFLDVSDEAYVAASQGIMGGFKSGVDLANAKWRTSGKPGSLVIDGNTIPMNSEGYPTGSTADTAGCIEIWNTILQLPEPIIVYPGLVPVDDWSALRFGTACVFLNHHGEVFSGPSTLFFAYYPATLSAALPAGHVRSFNF